MADYLINITSLNDFLFCPYSIYLHNAFMDTDGDVFVALPQIRGKHAHKAVDSRTFSKDADDIQSLKVFSEDLGLVGVIDLYRKREKHLVEFKHKVSGIFLGQKLQLWAQYFCLTEMGYDVEKISVFEKSTGIYHEVKIPDDADRSELMSLIEKFRSFDLSQNFDINPNKCAHCIYCSLCHLTNNDNVYS